MSIDAGDATQPPANTAAAELLRAWWQAGTAAQAAQWLARLLAEHADPVIRGIVAHRLSRTVSLADDDDDIRQEVTLQLLARLQHFKETDTPPQIEDFPGYVATIAHRACSLYQRRRFPHYARLKDQLRYILLEQPGLALWQALNQIWLSGFAAWRALRKQAVATGRVRDLRDDPTAIAPRLHGSLVELLNAIFGYLGAPVEFDALIKLVAALRGIRDTAPPEHAPVEESLAERLEQRLYLQRLWQEICQLPLPHRTALLLNLREGDERGLIVLLVELRLTTLHQLADVLGLAPLEFAELWRALPVDDARIAELLGLTRQQIINLRNSARRQLASRMRVAASPPEKCGLAV